VTDRADAPRNDPGWTSPEGSEYEQEKRGAGAAEQGPPNADPPAPRKPLADFIPIGSAEAGDSPNADAHTPFPTEPIWLSPEPSPPEGPRTSSAKSPSQPVVQPGRLHNTFRGPPQFGPPPPPTARDPRQTPPLNAGPPDTAPLGWQPGRHASHPPHVPEQAPQGPQLAGWTEQPWPGPDYGRVTRAPPASYTEWIRVDELMPRRRVPPSRGWRLALYKATFGLVNVGPSVDEADAPVDQ